MHDRQRSFRAKHLFDRLAALLLLVLLSPLMIAVALSVLAVEGRPLLFWQERPGFRGKPFRIWKFRTMRGDERDGTDEERLTWLGRLLRSSSLDELPELFNVLRGEMSLVGPRPLLMQYLPRYSPEQMRRHDVRPGITGLAQISGRNELPWEERFELDVWYVDHGSLWLDLRILGLTLVKVITREGIRAPGHATMPEFMGSAPPGLAPASLGRPMQRTLRFSGRLAATAFLLQAALAAAVALIDPYGVTNILSVDGLNDDKTRRVEWGGRVERSIRLWQSDYDTLILGGSRAWVGLDPNSPALRGGHAYNAAVRDATLGEIDAIGRFALGQRPPRRVIISLNLSMFDADLRPGEDFEESGFAGQPMPLVYARTLLSPEALRDALWTLRDNLRGLRSSDLANGLHLRLDPDENYRRAFDEVLTREYLVKPWHYAHFEYDRSRIVALRRLVADFAASGSDVYVFVAPVHARQIEAMHATGVYPVFERWLVDLTTAIAGLETGAPDRGRVSLWDFTGYSRFTTEDIPDPGDPATHMKWYWNSALHTPALGDVVLSKMLGRCACPDFGARLTSSSIRQVLIGKQIGRQRYVRAHPGEVAEVVRLVRKAARTLPTPTRRHDRLHSALLPTDFGKARDELPASLRAVLARPHRSRLNWRLPLH